MSGHRRSGLALGVLAVVVLAWVLGRLWLPPYDDALFFRRFAHHLLTAGSPAWNLADGPVHGNTAQLWQLVVTGLAAVVPDHTVFAGRVASALALVGAGALLIRPGRGTPVVLALASPVALATVVSGMETALVLFLGAALVRLRGRTVPAALLIVALYLARPDTALLSVPTVLLAEGRLRDRALTAVAGAAGIGLVLLVLHGVYGSALPLSFHLKSGLSTLYDEHFLALSRASRWRHLALFGVVALPLTSVAAAAPRRTVGLWAPAAAFALWHATVTVDVMGLHARFFAPCLPWLAAAAAEAWTDARDRPVRAGVLVAVAGVGVALGAFPPSTGWVIGRLSLLTLAAAVLAGGALLTGRRIGAPLSLVVGATLLVGAFGGARAPRLPPSDAAAVRALSRAATSWRGIGQLRRCLGPDIHVAHSEIGVPGMMFLDGRVTDLGGLMNPDQARGDWSFDAWCAADAPDALFLPHRNYRALNAEIAASACIQRYVRVVEKSSSPLHIRADRLADWDCAAE